jgi:hypothetical protein
VEVVGSNPAVPTIKSTTYEDPAAPERVGSLELHELGQEQLEELFLRLRVGAVPERFCYPPKNHKPVPVEWRFARRDVHL